MNTTLTALKQSLTLKIKKYQNLLKLFLTHFYLGVIEIALFKHGFDRALILHNAYFC